MKQLKLVISFCMFICTFDWLSAGHGGNLVMKATWQGDSGHAIRNGWDRGASSKPSSKFIWFCNSLCLSFQFCVISSSNRFLNECPTWFAKGCSSNTAPLLWLKDSCCGCEAPWRVNVQDIHTKHHILNRPLYFAAGRLQANPCLDPSRGWTDSLLIFFGSSYGSLVVTTVATTVLKPRQPR